MLRRDHIYRYVSIFADERFIELAGVWVVLADCPVANLRVAEYVSKMTLRESSFTWDRRSPCLISTSMSFSASVRTSRQSTIALKVRLSLPVALMPHEPSLREREISKFRPIDEQDGYVAGVALNSAPTSKEQCLEYPDRHALARCRSAILMPNCMSPRMEAEMSSYMRSNVAKRFDVLEAHRLGDLLEDRQHRSFAH